MELLHSCRWCGNEFEITTKDLAFYEKVSPVFGGKKYQMPPPTLCPECRLQRRFTWRNERKLYTRQCDLCGEEILSSFSSDKKVVVYCTECWNSDAWDGISFGTVFSWDSSFFSQYEQLLQKVPLYHLKIVGCENCDYCVSISNSKNCYLISGCKNSEWCLYGDIIMDSSFCVDCEHIGSCQYCYSCIESESLYQCFFVMKSISSRDCTMCFHIKNCEECIGCADISNKQYFIFNKPYSKEEYFRKKQELLKDFSKLQDMFISLKRSLPHRFAELVGSENASGDNIYHSKNIKESFDIHDSEDVSFGFHNFSAKDSYDCIGGAQSILIYEGQSPGLNNYLLSFSFIGASNRESFYLGYCQNCRNCFGCVGLKKNQYCILNKQYTKEEYETLVPKIIEKMIADGEWGEFFDPKLSPFGYNETVAQEYFPLTKEEALQRGFNWSDYVPPPPNVSKIIPASKLPDNIKDIPDDILNWAIECEITKKPFRIIKQELKFYREHNLPIPRRHPDQRHKDRMALRNPRKLWTRQCDCVNGEHKHSPVDERHAFRLQGTNNTNDTHRCPHIFQTTYSPDRAEKIYCEECYLKEVY